MTQLILMTRQSCNNNCIFCSEKSNKNKDMLSLEIINKIIKKHKSRDHLILMGETTLRPDIINLLNIIQKEGFKTVSFMSNGRMLSNYEFCKKIVSLNTITDFLINTPAHKQETHEKITQVPGSFKQTKKAIQNLKKLKQYVAGYVIIIKENYEDLPKIADYLIELNVDEVQPTFVFPLGYAKERFDKFAPQYKKLMPYLENAIEKLKNKNVKISINGIPSCIIEKYGRMSVKFNSTMATYIKEVYEEKDFDYIDELEIDKKNVNNLKDIKTKFSQCKQCIKNNSCEGVWNRYAKEYGGKEFKPIKNE